ncbi:MAG: ABC transporter transmembrane domain-containing protein, partial [Acidobacteriota bacterium]
MKGFALKTASAGSEAGGNSWGSLKILAPYFKRYWLRVSSGFTALLVVDLLQLLIPRVIKQAVDALQGGTATHSGLLTYGMYILLIAGVIAGLRYFWRTMLLGFSRLLETQLRSRMFSHILTLDRSFFQRRTPGEIMALATNDLTAVQLA